MNEIQRKRGYNPDGVNYGAGADNKGGVEVQEERRQGGPRRPAHDQRQIGQPIDNRTAQQPATAGRLKQMQGMVEQSRARLQEMVVAGKELQGLRASLKSLEDRLEVLAPRKPMDAAEAKRNNAEKMHMATFQTGDTKTNQETLVAFESAHNDFRNAREKRDDLLKKHTTEIVKIGEDMKAIRPKIASKERNYKELIQEHNELWIELRNLQGQGSSSEMDKLVDQVKQEKDYHQEIFDGKIEASQTSVMTIASVMLVFCLIMAVVLYATNNLPQFSVFNKALTS